MIKGCFRVLVRVKESATLVLVARKLDRTLRTEQRIEELQYLLQIRPKIKEVFFVSNANSTVSSKSLSVLHGVPLISA